MLFIFCLFSASVLCFWARRSIHEFIVLSFEHFAPIRQSKLPAKNFHFRPCVCKHIVDCARSHVCAVECVVVSKQDSPYRLWLFIIIGWKTKNTRFWGENWDNDATNFSMVWERGGGGRSRSRREGLAGVCVCVLVCPLLLCELEDVEFLDLPCAISLRSPVVIRFVAKRVILLLK